VTAFVFSAFHLDPVGLAARFELGLLFGLLAWRSGSLWPAMAAHGANNLISSLLFLGAGEAREEDLVWWVPVSMFLAGNLALVALARFSRTRLVAPAEDTVPAPEKPQTCARCGVFLEGLVAGHEYCAACAVRPEIEALQLSQAQPPPVWPLFRPWIVAATVAVGLLLAVDWRGVQLNLLDAQLQPGKSVSKRAEVKELRARVRRGEAGVREYELLLRTLKGA
jgi:hypothetical protein